MTASTRSTNSEGRRIRVLIVDKHELTRLGLRSIVDLEKDLLVVGEARTLADTISLVKRQPSDIMLVDARLPDGSGPEACSRLLAVAPQLRIVLMTMYAEVDKVIMALKNGAKGYIHKDVRAEELIRAIRVVAGGQAYLDPEITGLTLSWIKALKLSPGNSQGITQLSPQEWLIMPLLVEGKTNREIAAQLQLNDKTIKNSIANIFSKIHVKRRTEAVRWYMKKVHSEKQFLNS